jgi:hypothetical protein
MAQLRIVRLVFVFFQELPYWCVLRTIFGPLVDDFHEISALTMFPYMVDLQGRPYRTLPTALLYQTKYVADCTCRGNPWDEAALARHRTYAEEATKKLAGKTAELASPERHSRGQLKSARRE